MTELQQNRYDQLLRRVGDLKGPGSKVGEVLTELFPVLEVEGYQGELQALNRRRLGIGATFIVGAAGEIAKIQLFNPTGSGLLVTVTSMTISSTATQEVRYGGEVFTLAGGIGTQVPRDLRQGLTAFPTAQMFSESSVGVGPGNGVIALLADQSEILNDENGLFVLSPGTGLTVGAGVVATRITCTFFWRERAAEPSELNF